MPDLSGLHRGGDALSGGTVGSEACCGNAQYRLRFGDMADSSGPVTFAALFGRFAWCPIANCPGRYLLAGGPVAMPPDEIVPGGSGGSTHVIAATRDPVIVTPFDDGGLISYCKGERRFLHTLNTREGFERKIRQLGLVGRI